MITPTLPWLTGVSRTLFALYDEELHRAPDPEGLAGWIWAALNGATGEAMRAGMQASDEYALTHPPAPVIPPITAPLHIKGTTFRLPDDTIWKWHGASYFRLLKHYLDGKDLRPVFTAARGYGINLFRVFSRLSWATLRETDYTDDQLLAFVRLLAQQGFRVELVALANCAEGDWTLSLDQQRAHVARLARVLAGEPNVLFELANEWNHASNRVDPGQFSHPRGLWSRGSHAEGVDNPYLPPWDYLTEHGQRKPEWPRTAKDILEFTRLGFGLHGEYNGLQIPGVEDEPMGVAGANPHDGRSDAASDFFDYFAVADLYGAGATIHSQDWGLDGQPLTDAAKACFGAIAAAWQAGIPPDAQLGTYTRGPLADCPLEHSDSSCLRTFAMLQGNKATAVRVRATVPPVARAGWRIVSTSGSVVHLER